MTCIPLHKFGRWTYFGWTQWQRFESSSTHHFWDTPQHFLKTHICLESVFLSFLVPEQRWLAYHYTQLGRWTYFGWIQWQRFESSSTHHFWDTPQHFLKTHFCLESGFLSFLVLEQRWLAYHCTNLADEPNLAEHNGKGLKALALTISEILHSIFSKHIFA